MNNYIFERLHEASTWKGLIFIITALGMPLSDEQSGAVINSGMALVGLVGVFLPDRFKKNG